MDANLSKSGGGIVPVTRVVVAEVAERKAVQVPTVSRVTEGAEVGVVRRNDDHLATVGQQTVCFFHHADDIANVLNDMDGADLPEGAVAKRIMEVVEVGNHVSGCIGVAIKADRAGEFVTAAADIEDALRQG